MPIQPIDEVAARIAELRAQSGARHVAANLIIDPNNAAWQALRSAAEKNPMQTAERARYMLAQLDDKTGSVGLVLNYANAQTFERPEGPITHIPAHSFCTVDQADLWLALNASPRFRYLLLVAKQDYDVMTGVDKNAVPTEAEIDSLFTKHGYSRVDVTVHSLRTNSSGTPDRPQKVWPTSLIYGATIASLTQMGFFEGSRVSFTEEAHSIVMFASDDDVSAAALRDLDIDIGTYSCPHYWNGYGGVPVCALVGQTWGSIITMLGLA